MNMKCDIDCYRVNYSKDWLAKSKDGYHIEGFPCYGAVTAINLLCDEVVALRKEVEQRDDNNESETCEHDLVMVEELRCHKCGWVSSSFNS